MFFKQKSNVLFRNYESFGYITDNRNYEYIKLNKNSEAVGDKIVSPSGAIFLNALDRKPKSLVEIVKDINQHFTNVDIKTITNDVKDFYMMLEQDGFIVSGKTLQECNEKDPPFSYKTLESDMIKKDLLSTKFHTKKSTQEFLDEYFEGNPQLTSLHLEITSRCNERCIHCYIPHDNKTTDINPDLFYDILKQSKKMNLLHLTLSGGEPMLHKNFFDFLKKCKEYDFSLNILSNLTLLNDEIISEMKKNTLLGIQVSLYSMDSTIHDEITQMKGSFKKTKDAILKLLENDIPMQISCPIMRQNINCYNDVSNWAKKHKIPFGDDYGIIARYNNTTQNLDNRLSINEIKEILNNTVRNDDKYLEKIEAEAKNKKDMEPNDIVCSICFSSICIAETGNVYPCAGWQNYILGNVNETSIKDIWNNSERVQYLRNLRKSDFPKCLQCDEKEYCTMCMVKNANEHPEGDPLVINKFFCDIVKLNKELVLDWKEKHISS